MFGRRVELPGAEPGRRRRPSAPGARGNRSLRSPGRHPCSKSVRPSSSAGIDAPSSAPWIQPACDSNQKRPRRGGYQIHSPVEGLLNNPAIPGLPSFRRKPESILKQNDIAHAIHLLIMEKNQSENKRTKAKQMDSGFRRNDDQNRRLPGRLHSPNREIRNFQSSFSGCVERARFGRL